MEQQLTIILRQSTVLTKASMKSRYRSTIAGFIWVMLLPIMIYAAQSYAFHFILKINVQNYPIFLLTGLIPWILIASSLEMSAASIVNQGLLLKSLPIHPLALIFSQLIDNFINYSAAFFVLVVPIGLYTQFDLLRLIYIFLPLISALIFILGLSQIINTLNVFFRDTKFVLSFVIQVSYFLTPIFYPKELIPENLQWYMTVNPFYIILAPFQTIVDNEHLSQYWTLTGKSFTLSLAILLISFLYWRRKRNAVYLSI